MSKISKYPAATSAADAEITVLVQGGVTKKIPLSVLKAYFNSSGLQNNLEGTRPPGVGDDSDDGYSRGSFWIDQAASPKEAYSCADATVGAAVWLKTTLTIDELGTGALQDIETPTAESDMLFAGSSPSKWVRKTLAQAKALLGLGGTVPAPTAANDFIVASGSPLDWAKKTLAEVLAIIMPSPGPIGETTASTVRSLIKWITKTATGDLSAQEVAGCGIDNYGQTDNMTLTWPAIADGQAILFYISTTVAKYARIAAPTGGYIWLDGTKGASGGYVGIASAAEGAEIELSTRKNASGGHDLFATTHRGTWVAG